jgi:hypothetical protein
MFKSAFCRSPIRFTVITALVIASIAGCTKKRSVEMPPAEAGFIDALNSFASQYNSAGNALQKGSLRGARRAQLAQICGDRAIAGWVGTLKEVTTLPNGDVAVSIQLPDSDVVVRTMTNSFGDISSKTLITKDSPMHDRAAGLSKGAMVKFDGTFLFGSDYLKEVSTNEHDSLTKPEFLVQFKDISPKS